MVLADKLGAQGDTAVVSMVIVSTFGLTADEHARAESAWGGWWSDHHLEVKTEAGSAEAADRPER